MNHWLAILICIIAIENIFDYISTSLIIKKGRGQEANPVIAFAIRFLGTNWWVVKVLDVAICAALWSLQDRTVALIGALLVVAVYVYVLQNNYRVLWRQL